MGLTNAVITSEPVYIAVKKKRSKFGSASLGWFLGHGYVSKRLRIKYECWCVVDAETSKIICDCISKSIAEKIAMKMNS